MQNGTPDKGDVIALNLLRFVDDTANFWCQYYMEKPLEEWISTS